MCVSNSTLPLSAVFFLPAAATTLHSRCGVIYHQRSIHKKRSGAEVNRKRLRAAIIATLFLLECPIFGGSATWSVNPTSGDWNTAANWTPPTVPNDPSDIATFASSSLTEISISQRTVLLEMVFNSGASAYHFTIQRSGDFGFYGAGLQNNSGAVQLFDVLATDTASDYTYLTFPPGSTAGSNVVITTHGADFADGANPGVTQLFNASAGSATLINNGGLASGARGGEVDFLSQLGQGSHAGNATIINNPGTVAGALGGRSFFLSGSADNAVITSEGATVSGALGGITQFLNNTGAGSATLIANAGTHGGEGGVIQFEDFSFAPNARFEVFGNGRRDISLVDPGSLRIGSLEGDGQVFLGTSQLSVGATNLDTTFSGVIHDSGSLEKIGNASFTLTGANVYTGGTTVSSGTLVVGNVTGSATGTGAVAVNSGTLGGNGIIAGSVTVGTGSGNGAFLAPAHGGNQQLTLTIQSTLTLNSDSTYTYTFKAKRNRFKIDKVIANGVTINSGATINLSGTTQGQLTQGMVLTLIKNTDATPINGTFSNLPDGGIVTIDGNNLQASYTGGDGNDLTLTVVP